MRNKFMSIQEFLTGKDSNADSRKYEVINISLNRDRISDEWCSFYAPAYDCYIAYESVAILAENFVHKSVDSHEVMEQYKKEDYGYSISMIKADTKEELESILHGKKTTALFIVGGKGDFQEFLDDYYKSYQFISHRQYRKALDTIYQECKADIECEYDEFISVYDTEEILEYLNRNMRYVPVLEVNTDNPISVLSDCFYTFSERMCCVGNHYSDDKAFTQAGYTVCNLPCTYITEKGDVIVVKEQEFLLFKENKDFTTALVQRSISQQMNKISLNFLNGFVDEDYYGMWDSD